jgi:branched-chain amino acid aminotransferase
MGGNLLLNGCFHSDSELVFSATQRIWQFGDGIFESIRVIHSKPQLVELHINRLLRSATILGWVLPADWDKLFWEKQIKNLLSQNENPNLRLKLCVFREAQGAYLPQNSGFSWLIKAVPLTEETYSFPQNGLKLARFYDLKKTADYLSLIKTTAAIRYVQAAVFAENQHADDALLYNTMGRPCETASAALFIVKNNIIFTPPLSEFCLDSVMRKHIITLAASLQFTLIEKPLTDDDLSAADGIFIANAIKGIRWVAEVETFRFSKHTLFDDLYLALLKAVV